MEDAFNSLLLKSMVPGPTVLLVLSSLEIQNLRPHPSPTGSEATLTSSPCHLPFHSSSEALPLLPLLQAWLGSQGHREHLYITSGKTETPRVPVNCKIEMN